MNLLLDVDTQADFMYKEGNLYVPDAEKIILNIMKVMSDKYMPIISTVDEHDENDPEFSTFPPHCIWGSSGARKIVETSVYGPLYLVKRNILDDDDLRYGKQFIVTKKTYNVWDEALGNPATMKKILNYFKPEIVYVVGVATDICVKAAVIGMAPFIPKICIIENAVKGLSKDKEEEALREMISLGNVVVI